MYVTIKLEGNVDTIHSVNVDGKEIIPELQYNIAPQKFVHGGHDGFGLREAVDRILNKKESKISENKELERRDRERKEIENTRKEYYEKHMKEETERLNKFGRLL